MADLPIIIYHYTYSPYARRVVWYLALRGIPYVQCVCRLLQSRGQSQGHMLTQ